MPPLLISLSISVWHGGHSLSHPAITHSCTHTLRSFVASNSAYTQNCAQHRLETRFAHPPNQQDEGGSHCSWHPGVMPAAGQRRAPWLTSNPATAWLRVCTNRNDATKRPGKQCQSNRQQEARLGAPAQIAPPGGPIFLLRTYFACGHDSFLNRISSGPTNMAHSGGACFAGLTACSARSGAGTWRGHIIRTGMACGGLHAELDHHRGRAGGCGGPHRLDTNYGELASRVVHYYVSSSVESCAVDDALLVSTHCAARWPHFPPEVELRLWARVLKPAHFHAGTDVHGAQRLDRVRVDCSS